MSVDNNEPIILEGEEAQRRKDIRVNEPLKQIMDYLTTTDFNPWKNEHEEFIQKMQNEPYITYKELKNRLILEGQMVSFPEFKGVVAILIEKIFQTDILKYYQDDKGRSVILETLIHKLIAIMTKSRYYFPYVSTLYAIESMLILLDTYYRETSTESLPNFYHNFRYRSYLDYIVLTSNPENIVIPTFVSTGATFFVKIRCVPILVLGVAIEPTLADQYINSPLDFWAHDIQHARRQIQETSAYYDRYVKHRDYYSKRDPFNIVKKDDFYYKMSLFTQKTILPIIIPKKNDDEKTKAYKRIMKLIIFEVVHEKAWPITALAICRCIPLLYDVFPIETLTIIDDNGVKSIDTIDRRFNDPTTLSNLRGKLRHGFYDKVNNTIGIIVPEKYRTSQNISICAKIILTLLGCKCNPDMSLLLKLTKDPTNAGEFAQVTSIKTPDVPNDSYDITYSQEENDQLNKCDNLEPNNIIGITDVLSIPPIPSPEKLNEYINQDFSDDANKSVANDISAVQNYGGNKYGKTKKRSNNRRRKSKRRF